MPIRTLLASIIILTGASWTLALAQGPGGGICFFEDANFEGRQLCISPGERIPRLDPSWNDQISSAEVPAGTRVTLCEHADFGGRCILLDRSLRNFQDIDFNYEVSSISAEGVGVPRLNDRRDDRRIEGFGPRGPGDDGDRGDGLREPRDLSDRRNSPPADLREQMFRLRESCERGDTHACVRFGIIIGENRGRHAQWRREDPDLFWWER